ncbi:MAG: AsmA family protein, partial [Lysobacter sp.]
MSEPMPAAHDARIAELRQRRRARLRYLGVRAAVLAGALTLVVVVALYWLLTTIGGRELLLRQVVARLPANATLTWQQAEGPARGPLTLHGVRFAYTPQCAPDDTACKPGGPLVFTAQRVHLDYALRPLLGRRLRLQTLQVAGATLALPRNDEPFELPRWPESLPRIAPPLALQVDDLRIDDLKVSRAGEPLIDALLINIRILRGGLDAQQGRLHVERLVADSDRGRFTVHGDYAPRDDYRSDLTATAVLPATAGRMPARLGFVARGDLSRMDVALAGAAPGPLRATLTLRGEGVETTTITGSGKIVAGPTAVKLDKPQWQLRVAADALDLGLLTDPDAAASDTPLTLQLHADGRGGDARVRGELRQGVRVAKVLTSQVRIQDQVLRLNPLHLQVLDGTLLVRGSADFNQPENATFRFAANARDLRWGGAASGPGATPPPAIEADADFGLAGTRHAWALIGTASLARDGQRAQLKVDGRGTDERMTLNTLKATMPTGTLDAKGEVAWAPTLQWHLDATLAGFDPGYFAA